MIVRESGNNIKAMVGQEIWGLCYPCAWVSTFNFRAMRPVFCSACTYGRFGRRNDGKGPLESAWISKTAMIMLFLVHEEMILSVIFRGLVG